MEGRSFSTDGSHSSGKQSYLIL